MEENTNPEPQEKPAKAIERPSIALIIGSEGIKSFCALPFIEYLQKENIKVDLVIGVSGGALLAAFLGAGYNLTQIQDIFSKAVDPRFFREINHKSVMDIADIGQGKFSAESGILKTDSLRKTYETLFKNMDISDLKPKTLITTTDLTTGLPVILEKGNLAQAIYASSAVYPLMPPANIDGKKLIDGAFSSPMPIMECVKRHIDIIIAIYFDDACNPEPENFIESYFNSSRIFRRSILTSQLPLSIDMHHHEIIPIYIRHPRPIEMWEIKKITEIVHAGKVALTAKKGNFKEAVFEFKKKVELKKEELQRKKEDKNKTSGTLGSPAPKNEPKNQETVKRKIKIVKSNKERTGA
ncbi:NTE family protein [Maridesulfovibrio ferrireducens]|uniref:NTE family protein n=1 Tax=Maridesulfovibrio ferrireducens TaxID=246191 RepID=A0A1G9EM21_9BACT|nr:patatin-like phospholipase family protein [Maridesulfovibrio ferrireducens]SDK77065.1 NTE family protein [Maridesulfovibrio ferrireducens]